MIGAAFRGGEQNPAYSHPCGHRIFPTCDVSRTGVVARTPGRVTARTRSNRKNPHEVRLPAVMGTVWRDARGRLEVFVINVSGEAAVSRRLLCMERLTFIVI